MQGKFGLKENNMIGLITFLATLCGVCWVLGWIIGLLRTGSFRRTWEEWKFLNEEDPYNQKRKQKLHKEQCEREYQEYLRKRRERLGW